MMSNPLTLGKFLPDWEPLSLSQQVAQLIMVRTTGHLFDGQRRYPRWEASNADLQHWIQELGIGGVILLGGSAAELALRTEQLQAWSQVPLLMAADIEEGVGRRFEGATWMPPPLALGAIAQQDLGQACNYARQLGTVTAREAKAIGINWILGPVVDVNNNPGNPVINVRAFGETPEVVIPLIEAFIQGTQGWGVLTAAKHFPGHGDTASDSHVELPLIPHSRERLEQIELAPFWAAIATKVSAIMTAHLQVPALDPDHPSSLSSLTLTNLLRQEMGFDGLIVTDALVMQAITKHYGAYEAPVMALEAGSDVILMPVDPPGTIAAICEAVQTGRLSRERIHASLERIWRAKQVACTPTLESGAGHAWETESVPTFQLEAIAQP
ncbi:MAG: glycoside hydrolase family 3 N-terminal domain-containing protein, partial [Leptolyngbyaceae cyanobacterium]